MFAPIAPGAILGSSASMIYILAFFIPPLALLLNGQLFAASLNFVLIVPCLFFGLIFHVLLLVPSAHAIIAIYHAREKRKHREIVEPSASTARRRAGGAKCISRGRVSRCGFRGCLPRRASNSRPP